MKEASPTVSFLIPVYNAEAFLERCLKAIKKLRYPANKIEVIVADGGSTDNTRLIAMQYGALIVNNPQRVAEFGKKNAFEASTGKYVVLIDADNVISSRNWLKKMLKPFKDPRTVGVESNYLIANDFTSLNKYATLLVIVDPLARMLASKPIRHEQLKGYVIKKYAQYTWPISGANGFIWRRNIVEQYTRLDNELNEISLLRNIARQGPVYIGNVPKVGIYHYYCSNLADYLSKRHKIAQKHLRRSQSTKTWVDNQNVLKFALAIMYLVSILGPSIEALYYLIKQRRLAWLWHPLIAFITIVTYANSYTKHSLFGRS